MVFQPAALPVFRRGGHCFFAVLIGLVGGLLETNLIGSFVDGSRDLLGVALIIGIARGITVIMNNGMITDTVLSWAEEAVADSY